MSRFKIPDEVEWSQETYETFKGTATRDTAREVWRQIMRGEFDAESLDFLREFATRIIQIDTDANVPKKQRLARIGAATGLLGDEDEHAALRWFIVTQTLRFDNAEAEEPAPAVRNADLLARAREAGLIAARDDPRNRRTDTDELKLIARLRAQSRKRPRGGRK